MQTLDKEQFLDSNKGLIAKAAREFYFETPKFSFEDLVSVGNQGAIKALNKFDPKRKQSKITTYAYKAALREIRDFVRKNTYDLHVTSYQQGKHHESVMNGETDDKYSGPHSPFATRLDWEMRSDKFKKRPLVDVIPSGSPPPEQKMVVEEQKEMLMHEINRLSEQERFVIMRRYFESDTFLSIGFDMGLSKQRVQQIETKAMKLLKDRLEDKVDGFIARSDGLARRT